MSGPPPELIAAYQATRFCAKVPGEIVIRIGQNSEFLDVLLEEAGLKDWAFITASNPQSQPLSDSENASRHERLLADVEKYQPHVYQGEGVPDEGEWQPEISLLVLGITRSDALRLGKHYGQHAIVVGKKKSPAELLLC